MITCVTFGHTQKQISGVTGGRNLDFFFATKVLFLLLYASRGDVLLNTNILVVFCAGTYC